MSRALAAARAMCACSDQEVFEAIRSLQDSKAADHQLLLRELTRRHTCSQSLATAQVLTCAADLSTMPVKMLKSASSDLQTAMIQQPENLEAWLPPFRLIEKALAARMGNPGGTCHLAADVALTPPGTPPLAKVEWETEADDGARKRHRPATETAVD